MPNGFFNCSFLLLRVNVDLQDQASSPLIDPMGDPQLPLLMLVLAAKATHRAFYALMLALPLTGWAMASAGKSALSWFGLFDWPKLPVTRDNPLFGIAHEGHELLAWLALALVILHVGAALRHHFLLKDNVLRRMA